jgi:hypothetical protein
MVNTFCPHCAALIRVDPRSFSVVRIRRAALPTPCCSRYYRLPFPIQFFVLLPVWFALLLGVLTLAMYLDVGKIGAAVAFFGGFFVLQYVVVRIYLLVGGRIAVSED